MDAAVEGLLAVDLDALSDEELLGFTVSVERVVRRLPAVQDAVTAAAVALGGERSGAVGRPIRAAPRYHG